MTQRIDWRAAINAVSDVVQNRPRPLRELDQIYMKTGDMVVQAERVARWADGERLAFIGDGDAISVCTAYLQARGIVNYGPKEIVVYDFDERICNAITRFAEVERLHSLRSELYNCLHKFPNVGYFDRFYTNPPWGASNGGESVKVFVERGMEATGYSGEGLVVIADDDELVWCQSVLHAVQSFVMSRDFFVNEMEPKLHLYHLDDAPNLRSCNLFLKSLPNAQAPGPSTAIKSPSRLDHFYGENSSLRVRYVRELARLSYGKAHKTDYEFEHIEPETVESGNE